jgi:hypothetical protein
LSESVIYRGSSFQLETPGIDRSTFGVLSLDVAALNSDVGVPNSKVGVLSLDVAAWNSDIGVPNSKVAAWNLKL